MGEIKTEIKGLTLETVETYNIAEAIKGLEEKDQEKALALYNKKVEDLNKKPTSKKEKEVVVEHAFYDEDKLYKVGTVVKADNKFFEKYEEHFVKEKEKVKMRD